MAELQAWEALSEKGKAEVKAFCLARKDEMLGLVALATMSEEGLRFVRKYSKNIAPRPSPALVAA